MAGRSVLLLGPSGSGKSTTLRSALRAEGSGVVLMAPGSDEAASYEEFKGRDGYIIEGFDDPEFMPLIGSKKVEGLANAMKWANALRAKCAENAANNEPLKYKLACVDRIDGFGQLAVNVMMKVCGITEAPPAQSPEGMRYYTGIANLLNQFMRPLRAAKGYGCHLLITSHVVEREVKKTSMAGTMGTAEVANIPGSQFRESLNGICDVVLYAGVNTKGRLIDGHNDPANPRHCLQWRPDPDRPTKSRLGPLTADALVPNEWSSLKPLIDAAAEARNAEAA